MNIPIKPVNVNGNGEARKLLWWMLASLFTLVILFGSVLATLNNTRISKLEAKIEEDSKMIIAESNRVTRNETDIKNIQSSLNNINTKLDILLRRDQ